MVSFNFFRQICLFIVSRTKGRVYAARGVARRGARGCGCRPEFAFPRGRPPPPPTRKSTILRQGAPPSPEVCVKSSCARRRRTRLRHSRPAHPRPGIRLGRSPRTTVPVASDLDLPGHELDVEADIAPDVPKPADVFPLSSLKDLFMGRDVPVPHSTCRSLKFRLTLCACVLALPRDCRGSEWAEPCVADRGSPCCAGAGTAGPSEAVWVRGRAGAVPEAVAPAASSTRTERWGLGDGVTLHWTFTSCRTGRASIKGLRSPW